MLPLRLELLADRGDAVESAERIRGFNNSADFVRRDNAAVTEEEGAAIWIFPETI